MNARAIIEALTGPSRAEVSEVVGIIASSATVEAANARLARSGYSVSYTDTDDGFLAQHHAPGGCLYGQVMLNPAFFGRFDRAYLTVLVGHELTHLYQVRAMERDGTDPQEIVNQKIAQFTNPDGSLNMDKYGRDPLEMQALARNAVDQAHAQGDDIKARLRRGTLDRYAPMPVKNKKRFGRYAYQLLQRGGY